MGEFIARHGTEIAGVLSDFDRICGRDQLSERKDGLPVDPFSAAEEMWQVWAAGEREIEAIAPSKRPRATALNSDRRPSLPYLPLCPLASRN